MAQSKQMHRTSTQPMAGSAVNDQQLLQQWLLPGMAEVFAEPAREDERNTAALAPERDE